MPIHLRGFEFNYTPVNIGNPTLHSPTSFSHPSHSLFYNHMKDIPLLAALSHYWSYSCVVGYNAKRVTPGYIWRLTYVSIVGIECSATYGSGLSLKYHRSNGLNHPRRRSEAESSRLHTRVSPLFIVDNRCQ